MAINRLHNYQQAGHSLVEVLAAMVLMSLIAGSLLTTQGLVSAWVEYSWEETAASTYAVAIAECLRSQRHLLEESNSGNSIEELNLPCVPSIDGMDGRLALLSPHPDNPRVYQVSITVSWEHYGDDRSMRLDTLMRLE